MAKTKKLEIKDVKCIEPVLRIDRFAWAKLLYINSISSCELAGFGISDKKDLLFIREFVILKQTVTGGDCLFDDVAVADYFDDRVDAGYTPEQFARIWIHTHPLAMTNKMKKISPHPSWLDERTFKRVFSHCDWAIMMIINSSGGSYVRLSIKEGFKANFLLPLEVESNGKRYNKKEIKAIKKQWANQYKELVTEKRPVIRDLDDDDLGYKDTNDFLPQRFRLPLNIAEDKFIAYCNQHGCFNFENWSDYDWQWWIGEFVRDIGV